MIKVAESRKGAKGTEGKDCKDGEELFLIRRKKPAKTQAKIWIDSEPAGVIA
jgi:hypothetical protein